MLDVEFVKKYRVLESDPDKWPTSRDLCTAHGQPGEWQIGLTMVFMRDAMFSKLEGDRARVIDERIRGLQVVTDEILADSCDTYGAADNARL